MAILRSAAARAAPTTRVEPAVHVLSSGRVGIGPTDGSPITGPRQPRPGYAVPSGGGATRSYRITVGDGRSTEQLVEAGGYGYAHSCVTSENFPARPGPACAREIVLLDLGAGVTAGNALREAARLGLERPTYDDALHFGIAHPAVPRERPVVFLHEPWVGHFGRRDVVCLWENAGRRELGLDSFDDRWTGARFAFVRPPARA